MIDPVSIARWHRIDSGTRMMNILPIHHVNGIVVTLFTPLVARSSVVVNRRFSATKFWKTVAAEKVAIVSVVPTILQFLTEAGEDVSALDLSAFRHVICGAGTLAIGVGQRWEDRFGYRVVHGYGLSETTCYDCFLPVDLTDAEHKRWMRDHGYPSIGCPIDVNEMDIQDASGKSMGQDARGEIVARGHLVMKHYYNRPDANRDAFANGWFRTGDEGFYKIGPDGRQYFFITGRIKELIIRGGVNISPLEVEEVMNQCPGVKIALAVGFDNDWYSEEVGAYVVVQEGQAVTEEDLIQFCLTRLPYSKCPKVVKFGTEIPVTATGKYQRLKLTHLFKGYEATQFKKPKG
jgi:long-chain acyl-CoA synthetase